MLNNILKSKKYSLYLNVESKLLNHSLVEIKFTNGYDEGSIDASLQAMETNLKEVIKDLQQRLKVVSEKKIELRQTELF